MYVPSVDYFGPPVVMIVLKYPSEDKYVWSKKTKSDSDGLSRLVPFSY